MGGGGGGGVGERERGGRPSAVTIAAHVHMLSRAKGGLTVHNSNLIK